jgi:hypothetical protein
MNAVELAKHKSAETLAESRADERSVAKGIASSVPAGGRKGIVRKGRRRWVRRRVPARSRQVCLASPSALEARHAGSCSTHLPSASTLPRRRARREGDQSQDPRQRQLPSAGQACASDYGAGTMPRSQRPAPLVPVACRRPRCGSLLSATVVLRSSADKPRVTAGPVARRQGSFRRLTASGCLEEDQAPDEGGGECHG